MSIFNFPDSPTLNQVHTEGSRAWTYNGTAWVANAAVGPQGPQGTPAANNAGNYLYLISNFF